jgi:anti-sigma factor RsiW
MASDDQQHLTPTQMADLSALADGTIDPARRAAVAAEIAASPALTGAYERERVIVERLQQARLEDRAPASLRARIEAGRPGRAQRARWRAGYGALTAGALAALIVVLALVIPGGTPGAPTVSEAAALGTRPSMSAVTVDPDNTALLTARVQQLRFPRWNSNGWKAVGMRTDRLRGRRVVTVYYRNASGVVVAYSVVATPALAWPAGASAVSPGYFRLYLGGRTVVTWQSTSHNTCVISAPGRSQAALLQFAENA